MPRRQILRRNIRKLTSDDVPLLSMLAQCVHIIRNEKVVNPGRVPPTNIRVRCHLSFKLTIAIVPLSTYRRVRRRIVLG